MAFRDYFVWSKQTVGIGILSGAAGMLALWGLQCAAARPAPSEQLDGFIDHEFNLGKIVNDAENSEVSVGRHSTLILRYNHGDQPSYLLGKDRRNDLNGDIYRIDSHGSEPKTNKKLTRVTKIGERIN